MMIKRIAFLPLFVSLLLACAARADGALLPVDLSAGPAPLETGYLSDTEYVDSTIRVRIETGREGDCDYWVADVAVKDASQLRTAAAADDFSRTRALDALWLARRMNAVVAVNGDYYNSRERGGFAYTVRQGVLYRDNLDERERRKSKRMDVLAIDEAGDFHVFHRPAKGEMPAEIGGKRVVNSFSFGPILVEDGEAAASFDENATWLNMSWDQKRQRMCICQAGPLHYKLVCCEGPRNGSVGMTLPEFAELAAAQDVRVAYNLDGGDSSFLYFRGSKVNSPFGSTRKLQDIIYFASAEGI